MAAPNPFTGDVFKQTSLVKSINELPFIPLQMTNSGLFANESRLTTTTAWIEFSGQGLVLLDVKPRGANGTNINANKRNAKAFKVPHIPARAEIYADEIQDVRQFGSETLQSNVSSVVNERLMKMKQAIDYTAESHKLASLKGLMVTADNTTVSLLTEFSLTQTSVNMVLGTPTTKLRTKTAAIIQAIEAALDGVPYTGIDCYCSYSFFTSLVTHQDVEDSVKNWNAAVELRNDPFLPLNYGGIRWMRYRGTSGVNITDGEAYAIPTGVSDLFVSAYAPAPVMSAVNTTALPYYAFAEPMSNGDGNKGMILEAQTNLLTVNTRPDASVKVTAS